MKELRDLVEQLNPHWRKYDTNKPPKNLVLAPGFKVSRSVMETELNYQPFQEQAYKNWAAIFFPSACFNIIFEFSSLVCIILSLILCYSIVTYSLYVLWLIHVNL